MTSYILEYLHEIFGEKLLNPDLQIAFSQGKNRRLALIGDSILNLVVKLEKFEEPSSLPEDIDNARKDLAARAPEKGIPGFPYLSLVLGLAIALLLFNRFHL